MFVVKVGGGSGINYESVCLDFASIVKAGKQAILVHGGSYETNLLSTKLGKPPRMVTSVSGYESRYTDRETLEIFEMVYCGKINKGVVQRLQQHGIDAIGLCGIDGRIFEGARKAAITILEKGRKKVLRDDYTGRVEKVNVNLIRLLLDHGYTPVLTPPAISYEGEAINVDGDRAAAILASALHVETLIILSNVPGLLKNIADETTLITNIRLCDIEHYVKYAQGRMRKKILGAVEAVQHGVKQVILADARIEEPISAALAGRGTVIH